MHLSYIFILYYINLYYIIDTYDEFQTLYQKLSSNIQLNNISWYGVFLYFSIVDADSHEKQQQHATSRALMWLFHVRLFWIRWRMPRHAQSYGSKYLRLNKTRDGWQLLVWLVVWLVVWIFFKWLSIQLGIFHHPNCYFHSMIFQRGRYTKPPTSSRTVHFCWPGAVEAPSFQRSCNELVFDHR